MNQRGFSLLETLVALAILVTAMLGPITLAAQSIKAISAARNEITAVFLAQDAIEFVRARKSTNSYQSQPWLSGFDFDPADNDCFHPTRGCLIDTVTPNSANTIRLADTSCDTASPIASCYLQRENSSGAYGYDFSGAHLPTQFVRRVLMTKMCPEASSPCPGREREARVRVEISWLERFGIRTISIESEIFCYERPQLVDCDDNIDNDGI